MRLVKSNQDRNQPETKTPMLRLVLYQGEVYRLPETSQGLRVLSGIAWITAASQDIFLTAGEKTLFSETGDIPLVSALGRVPLVLEVWGANDVHVHGVLVASRQVRQRAA